MPPSIPLRSALAFWFKLGWISFGGPAGQIALMHHELVERRRWLSERRFLHALNYCMLLPGPEAQQLATYIGWLMHRTWGGLIAGVLFVLPSLLILIALSWLYVSYGQTPLLAAVFYGIKPVVTAIVVQAVHRIGGRTLKNGVLWGIAVASFIALFVFNLPFPLIVLGAAVIGWLGGRIAPEYFHVGGGHGSAKAGYGPALIDDDTPRPAHAQFKRLHLLKVLLAGALLWLAPMAVLALGLGHEHTLTQMAWFFTKAALLTFGGAYAVLPYVVQGAVGHYGWLSPTQMIDGLALGETTPGPLIMVVAFVAFVGGAGAPDVQALTGGVGAAQALAAGALAAALVTWFTFLPSFVFILAGGPLVESTRDDMHFTAPLTAITAAVVGVVLNLALFFASHVLWPVGGSTGAAFSARPDLLAGTIALVAGIALFRYRRSVIELIIGGALAGLLLHLSSL